MAKITAMAPDSAGFKVLVKLYHLGGKAQVTQLMEALWTEFRSAPRFEQIATKPLLERGLVKKVTRRKADWLTITNEGRLMVRRYQASIPQQRETPAPSAVLNVKKYLNWGQTRPGALDYRQMPSLMGGERVPYMHDDAEAVAK